jgi:hypothetical protein
LPKPEFVDPKGFLQNSIKASPSYRFKPHGVIGFPWAFGQPSALPFGRGLSHGQHREAVYTAKDPENRSTGSGRISIGRSPFLDTANIGHAAGVIDVGGGASTLIDDLLVRGYSNMTLLGSHRC